MKKTLSLAGMAVLVAVSGVASTGCVGKKLFRTTVATQDEKITGVQSAVEENEKRVGDLRTETRSEIDRLDGKAGEALTMSAKAGERAATAERLARGSLLWETTLTNEDVTFDFNKASLKPGGQTALDDVANRIKQMNRQVYVEVQGHTDSVGDSAYNQQLGLKRAESVRAYLHDSQGIPLHVIEAISYGEDHPVADNKSRDGRAANRRVVIRVLDPTASIASTTPASLTDTQAASAN